jgi:hypothetical protein
MSAPFPSVSGHCDELALAYASRAIAFYQVQEFEDSLFDANQSIALLPTVEILFHKAYCLTSLQRFAESKQLVEEIIEKVVKKELNLKNRSIEELRELKRLNVRDLYYFGDNSEVMAEDEESSGNFWIHPSCEIRSTERKGRHLIAKNFIPKGTVVLIEKPYNVVLFDKNIISHCNACFKNIGRRIHPCETCDELVFCDQKCAEEAMDRFHKYECGFTGMVHELGLTAQHVFRMFTKIGCENACEFEDSVARNGFDINEFLEDERQQTVPEKDKTESERIVEYKAVITLLHHNSEQNKYMNIFHTFTAIKAAFLLNYCHLLPSDIVWDLKSFVEFVDIVIINMRRVLTNVFGWFEYPQELKGQRNHVANCHCFIASLMNHSCDPNTYWEFIDRKITFTAIRNINAGEEINDTYGPLALASPFFTRQKRLKENYFFTCNCSACLEDAKTVPALQCLSCDGPVVHNLKSKTGSCLVCGRDYRDIAKSILNVEYNKILFDRMIKNFRNGFNSDMSLSVAQKSLDAIIRLIYHKSYELLAQIRELLKIFVKLGRFSDAVKYCKYFLPSIYSSESISGVETLEDMLLLTDIYYKHLRDERVDDKEDWDTCFEIYFQLFQCLKDMMKKSRLYLATDEDRTQVIKDVIKLKKEEFQNLETVFSNL